MKNFFPFQPPLPVFHFALDVEPNARAQWADVTWVQGDRIRASRGNQPDLFLWSGKTPEGTWLLSPMPESATYRIAFLPDLNDQQREGLLRQSKQLDVNDPRRRLYALQIGMTDLGYARSAEDAQALIDHMRRLPHNADIDTALSAFKPMGVSDKGTHLERLVGRNALHLVLTPSTVKLEFHRKGSHRWDNLCRFEIQTHAHDGRVLPNYWPPTIAHPLLAATSAALIQADRFVDSLPAPKARKPGVG